MSFETFGQPLLTFPDAEKSPLFQSSWQTPAQNRRETGALFKKEKDKGSGATQGVMFHAVLQTVEIGKPLFAGDGAQLGR